jgi:hypothetical protein
MLEWPMRDFQAKEGAGCVPAMAVRFEPDLEVEARGAVETRQRSAGPSAAAERRSR